MSLTLKSTIGIALSLLTASSASAGELLPRTILQPLAAAGYGYGYGYLNSTGTTANESFNRGRATLIRSIGERNVLDEQARNIREETIARRLDNILKAQQTRIAMRRTGEAERNLKFEKVHSRRLTTMAINDAQNILQNPSTASLETRAEARLRLARTLLENDRQEHAVNWLRQITQDYASTPAAAQAQQILDGLKS